MAVAAVTGRGESLATREPAGEAAPPRLQLAPAEELAADLRALLDNEALGDVEFVFAEGPPLHACRAVLAARCSHFNNMFFGAGAAMREGSSRRVEITDSSRVAFHGLLEVLCTGSIEASDPFVLVEVHSLLDRYNMTALASALCPKIVEVVTDAVIVQLAEAALQRGQSVLMKELVKRIVDLGGDVFSNAVETGSRDLLASILRRTTVPDCKLSCSILASTGSMTVGVSCYGANPGWNRAILAVPNTRRFSVRGVTKGRQVSLWICKWVEHSEVNIEFPGGTRARTGGTRLHLAFESHPVPRATLTINGEVAVTSTTLDANSQYHPCILCGDTDGLEELLIE